MHYLIDGHNLIPKLQGLSLGDIDDEAELIKIMQKFLSKNRSKAEVYFDGAPPGFSRTYRQGKMVIHFIQQHSSADAAIISHLQMNRRNAQQFCVVTSDNRILAEARSVGAKMLASEQFAIQLQNVDQTAIDSDIFNPESESEIEEWIRQFNRVRH